jgi:subtilisin family serine protease
VRVVSLSWLSGDIEPDLATAIRAASNTLFVTIPSGNGGAFDADPTNPLPCNLDAPNVLCVSTSAPDDGLDCGAYGASSVDVAVPTQNNQTTTNGGGWGPTGCATSFAAPAAAGVATILFGLDPAASPGDVKAAIVDSARRVAAWSGKSVSGGIVDAAAAVALFQQRRGIAAPPPGGGGDGSDTTPPTLVLTVSPARFSRTTQLAVQLSETANVRLTISRLAPGRRSRGRCIAPTRRLRHAPACTRETTVRRLTVARPGGPSTVTFDGKDSKGHRLTAARYAVRGQAIDGAGNRSPTVKATFRVISG